MNNTSIFSPFWSFSNNIIDYFLVILIGILIFLIIQLQNKKRGITTYNVHLAWIRGGIYFASCFIISILTGVFQTLISKPIATSENISNPIWWGFTLLCIAIIYFAYFILWRRGTLTHGRELHVPSVLTFGLLWGVSEGQLILSIWSIVEKYLSNVWVVGIVSFLIISTFKGLWQSQYWDVYVSPEHNIPEWNLKKVLLGHVPNLIFTLSYLAIFGNSLIFLIFQTTGLMICAYYMHFPKWTSDR
jgi:nucleoside recognition membrane protein YjiH